MSVNDIIWLINKKIKDTVPILSKEKGIGLTDKSLVTISKIVAETLEYKRASIELITKSEGIKKYELEKTTEEILHKMFLQAYREGKKEVLPIHFLLALTDLHWPWPFSSSEERSSGNIRYRGEIN